MKQFEAKTTGSVITEMVLDIETFSGIRPELGPAPELEPTPSLDEIKPHGSLKDPVKQQEYKEKKQKEIAEANLAAYEKAVQDNLDKQDKDWRRQSLDPYKGTVFCIGIIVNDGDPFLIMGATERELMEAFDMELAKHDYLKVVAHFGDQFDFWFLFVKGLQYGMRHVISVFSGLEKGRLIDTAKIIRGTNWDPKAKTSLDKMTFLMTGQKAKDDIHGSMVHDMVLEGKTEEVGAYCIKDTVALAKCYKIFKYFGLA